MTGNKVLLLALFLMCSAAAAEPSVIYDNGITTVITGTKIKTKKSILPVVSPSLSVGIIEKKKVNFKQVVALPLCVIGSDATSIQWLSQYRNQLKKLRAMCYLVQADNTDDLKRVAEVGKDIFIFPTSGKFLTETFGIKHYPVLISQSWIEQ